MNCGFSKNLIGALICQEDGGDLNIALEIDGDETVLGNGSLVCSKCGKIYEIKDGILDLLVSRGKIEEILKTEIDARDKEAEGYDKRLSTRYEKEIPSTLKALGKIDTKNLIEYGCGTGRFTVELVDRCAGVLATDFSRDSLLVLSKKLDSHKNIGLVLADATNLKTKTDFFDLAFSAQFLEHVPTKEKRSVFLKNVNKTLKDNGVFVCSVYHQDLRRVIKKQPQEGKHSSGIFYHYFKSSEIVEEFKNFFNIINLYPIDITLPLESKLHLSNKFSKFFERVPLVNKFGHLLLIKARKKILGHYSYGLFLSNLFTKHWFWFNDPVDVSNSAMVNFFSYNKIESDFKRTDGLTTIIDLNKSLDEIWEGMRKKFIRVQIEKGERNGVKIKEDKNFRNFRKIYRSFRREKGLQKDRFSVFKKHGILFSAYYKNKMVAGGVFISDGDYIRAWVLSSLRKADDGKMREIVGQANRMIIWEAIKYAKKTGHKLFDLGGISPNSTDRGLVSLAEFKESFGGERKENFYYYKVYSSLLKKWMRFRGLKNV